MWNDLTHLGVSYPDKILRTVLVYLALVLLLRLAGKRELAQLNTFDLVVMLLLSNVVQNAIIGPDNSLVGGLVGAAVLVGINALVVRATNEQTRLGNVIEGDPTELAKDGRWHDAVLKRMGIRQADAEVAVRRQNGTGVGECEQVTLEPSGAILAHPKPDQVTATQADVRHLQERLDEVLAALRARES